MHYLFILKKFVLGWTQLAFVRVRNSCLLPEIAGSFRTLAAIFDFN
jgi:hypothetical protein